MKPAAATLAATLAAAMIASIAAAQPPAVRPTERTPDCTTNCHSKQQTGAFLHGPNAVQACDACHEYVDPAKHTFQLKRPGQQLCNFCHIDKTGAEGPVVHDPVAKGQCTSCHDPHGSNHRKMLKKDTVNQTCTECHQDAMKGAHAHAPAADSCTNCHQAHTSSQPHLLSFGTRELCLTCHEKVGQNIAEATHPHDPAKGDCMQCHSPHATDQIKGLKLAPKDLCVSCHKQVGEAISAATHHHSAVTDGKSCLNCHTAHASEHEKQLVADPVTSCLECHKVPIKVDATRTVGAVAELANESMRRHGPVGAGDCAACHTVHGGTQERLLVRPYAPTFNQKFSEDVYALCLGCHDRGALIGGSKTEQTGFRDGERNLHVVHLMAEPQGRNCRACHTTHASKFKSQIAETVPFGQWKLPLNFKPTESGGSCAPGCHKVEKYDRVTPVKPLAKPGPGTPLAPAAPGTSPTAKPAGTPPSK